MYLCNWITSPCLRHCKSTSAPGLAKSRRWPKWPVCAVCSSVSDSAIPRTAAHQAPLSMEFSRQEDKWAAISFSRKWPSTHASQKVRGRLLWCQPVYIPHHTSVLGLMGIKGDGCRWGPRAARRSVDKGLSGSALRDWPSRACVVGTPPSQCWASQTTWALLQPQQHPENPRWCHLRWKAMYSLERPCRCE